MRIVRQSSYTAVPWKNGGGITREAIREPAEGESFRWRVSLAQIDASGPFSDFAAYRRYMVLLSGAGVVLRFSSGAMGAVPGPAAPGSAAPLVRELRRIGDMAEFDGGLATRCDLVNGPCMDLNLMVAKSLVETWARVESLAEPRTARPGEGRSLLVIPIDAAVELRCGGDACVLERWDLALLPGGGPIANMAASGPDAASGCDASSGRDAPRVGAQVLLAELPSA